MVEVERDSPSTTGVDVAAHFLIDAITSASAAAGTGVDAVFTEVRNEAGLRARLRHDRSELTLGYRYSAESDYWSHAVGLSAAQAFWGDTARVSLSLGRNFDSISARGRTPECAVAPSTSCDLDGWYAGATYTQVLSPVMLAQVSAETLYLDGFQGNIYRSVPNFGYERLPDRRLRTAFSPKLAYYVPETGTGLQLQYRYYFDLWPGQRPADGSGAEAADPWRLRAHMFELRIYQRLAPTLEARLSYRHYTQTGAQFWCDAVARSNCYSPEAVWYSTDPKLGAITTQYPEVKLLWDLDVLAAVPFLRWFAAGTVEMSYGYYVQNTSFGDAHVLQAGYRMPY